VKIWFSPYTLQPRQALNAITGAEVRDGCLLKVEYPDSSVGFADLHPWPELGDRRLAEQLERLRYDVHTPLTKNAMEITRLDAAARARNESLWLDQEIPENHYLMTQVPEDDAELCAAFAQGFDKIKLKMGRDLARETAWINQITDTFDLTSQLRLDFNSTLNTKTYLEFQNALTEKAAIAIDYIEDPVLWSKKTGFGATILKVALDRDVEKYQPDSPVEICPNYFVIKPAIHDTSKILEAALKRGRSVVFTSYMDHPLGQMAAMLIAMRAQSFVKMETCGLASQNAYEPNEFSERLVMRGPKLFPLEGIGLGWGEELERLKWNSL
jgi:o-succinylbenzoate synthase